MSGGLVSCTGMGARVVLRFERKRDMRFETEKRSGDLEVGARAVMALWVGRFWIIEESLIV